MVVCSDVEGKALETTVEKEDISGVQAAEGQKDVIEGPTSVKEITTAFPAVRLRDQAVKALLEKLRKAKLPQ
jgi:hypothetical protein